MKYLKSGMLWTGIAIGIALTFGASWVYAKYFSGEKTAEGK